MSAEAQIRQYAERIVRLEMERRERAEDIKEIKAEAKSSGFNVRLIATCVRLMLLEQDKQDAAIREHSELDLYLNAVGLLDGVETEDATPAIFAPEAQDEGQPVRARTASDDVSVRGAGNVVVADQSEEFVAVAEVGEAVPTAVEPASAPDNQVSRESASELQPDLGVHTSAGGQGVPPSPGRVGEKPGTHSDPHSPTPHTTTQVAA